MLLDLQPVCLQSETFTPTYAYDLFCLLAKTPLLAKMLHIGLQNPWFWLAICWVLLRKMQGFRL